MQNILTIEQFKSAKREVLLDHKLYVKEAKARMGNFRRVNENLANSAFMAEKDEATVMMMTGARARFGLDLLTLNYSGGGTLDELRAFYPTILEDWEAFAKAKMSVDEMSGGEVAILPLRDVTFHSANKLVCFAILLGWSNLLPRLVPLIEYNNPPMDGMLERLWSPFVSNRPAPLDECTRHLP